MIVVTKDTAYGKKILKEVEKREDKHEERMQRIEDQEFKWGEPKQ